MHWHLSMAFPPIVLIKIWLLLLVALQSVKMKKKKEVLLRAVNLELN